MKERRRVFVQRDQRLAFGGRGPVIRAALQLGHRQAGALRQVTDGFREGGLLMELART